jgi:hypothetical protein
VRDVQVTTGEETVVAWSESVAGRQRLSMSVAADGEAFGAPRWKSSQRAG